MWVEALSCYCQCFSTYNLTLDGTQVDKLCPHTKHTRMCCYKGLTVASHTGGTPCCNGSTVAQAHGVIS